jgi:predicted nucleic acid-binding protein
MRITSKTFLNSYGAHVKAVQLGNDLLNSKKVQFIQMDEPLFLAGWQYFQKHQDKTYSLTDCISFVVMHHSYLREAEKENESKLAS